MRLFSQKLSTDFIHNYVNYVNNLDKLSHMNYFLSTGYFQQLSTQPIKNVNKFPKVWSVNT